MIRDNGTSATKSVREQLLEALGELSALSPEWRIGQLVCNVADYVGEGVRPPSVWDATDEQLLTAARELILHRAVPASTK
jgi:hypothetical protein